jgi:hypothetical protein
MAALAELLPYKIFIRRKLGLAGYEFRSGSDK